MSSSFKIFFWLILFGINLPSYSISVRKFVDGPTPPVVNQVWVQGERYTTDTLPSQLSIIPLPFGKNFFVVEFISINYESTQKLTYGYKLEGVDSTWHYSGDQRRASYANLNPGQYPLKIRVSDDGRNWVYNQQEINVLVTPPFWARWWFNIGVILLVFAILWVTYQLRVNAAIKRALEIAEIRGKETESLRVMMAQDFHDEMGNKLASIIVLVSTLQMLIKDSNNEIQKALNRIEVSSKQLFDGTKSFIWSINPRSDQLDEIMTYICNFGAELFENTPITFKVVKDVPENTLKMKLPVGYSRQLFFIFKEAMTNCLVHSGASRSELSFFVDAKQGTIRIVFEDNGNGAKEEHLMSNRGITNMKTRAMRIGYRLTFFHNLEGGLGVQVDGDFPKS